MLSFDPAEAEAAPNRCIETQVAHGHSRHSDCSRRRADVNNLRLADVAMIKCRLVRAAPGFPSSANFQSVKVCKLRVSTGR